MSSSLPYLLYFHSIVRYLILLFALVVAVQSLVGMMQKKEFGTGNKVPALLLLIFCDLQLLMGLILYYFKIVSPGILKSETLMSDRYSRFYGIEHSLSMLVAVIMVHVAYSISKKHMDSDRKFKRVFWCAFIALAIFMAMTPWAAKQVVGRPNIPVLPA